MVLGVNSSSNYIQAVPSQRRNGSLDENALYIISIYDIYRDLRQLFHFCLRHFDDNGGYEKQR